MSTQVEAITGASVHVTFSPSCTIRSHQVHLAAARRDAGSIVAVLSVRSNFHVVRTMESDRMGLFAAGKYLDEVVLDEGRARFQKRVVVPESRNVDTLMVAL